MQSVSRKSDTSRYLNAVQAATNTVSSWLQKGNPLADSMQSIPSPVAAAAVQLHDERPIRNTAEVRPSSVQEVPDARLLAKARGSLAVHSSLPFD